MADAGVHRTLPRQCLWKMQVRADVGDLRDAAEAHDPVDLAAIDVEHVRHAGLAGDGQAPELRARDEAGARAERQRLDDIGAAPDAAVDEHRNAPRRRPPRRRAARRCDAGAPSSWRPPWLETISPSTPCSTRLAASLGMEDALEDQRPVPDARAAHRHRARTSTGRASTPCVRRASRCRSARRAGHSCRR